MHRGWMNVFRRWTCSDMFQQLWPVYRGQFDRDFIDFCEQELRLQPGQTHHVRTVDLPAEVVDQATAFLSHAFEREWPPDRSPAGDLAGARLSITGGLRGLIAEAGRLPLASPPVWLIRQEVNIPDRAGSSSPAESPWLAMTHPRR